MNKINYTEIIEALVSDKDRVIKATKYVSPNFIVRATRKTYGKKILKGNIELYLTIGKPNYAEREFIKQCKKAKLPFPVKPIVLKVYSPKKNKLSKKQ